jgi:hypothetical protein
MARQTLGIFDLAACSRALANSIILVVGDVAAPAACRLFEA